MKYKLDIQLFGGRGGRSGMSGGGQSEQVSAPPLSGGATTATQKQHADAVRRLSGSEYSDGTYDIGTMSPVEYNSGFQVTFSQIGDNYTDAEYANKVNEFLAVSSDGKTLAGKFQGTPEVSFHCNDRRTAIRLAKKYNQVSIWDWGACDEIKTGGTGRR